MFPNENKKSPEKEGGNKTFSSDYEFCLCRHAIPIFRSRYYRGAIRMAVKSGIEKFNINGSQKPMLLKLP